MDMKKPSVKSPSHSIFFVFLVMALVQLSCNLPKMKQPENILQSIQEAVKPQLPLDQRILQQADQSQYTLWLQQLSGEQPVTINGEETFIRSRYSYAMFLDYPEARVTPYLLEQTLQWVSADQIEIDPYSYSDAEQTYTWQNIIIRLPGQTNPQERILLTAHMDSTVVREGNALLLAPGADDNATGTAVLLEALRLLSNERFDKTIEIIFFSGEEEGYQGSLAYLQDHDPQGIQAVINVDMIGYDPNADACMEIHTGTDPRNLEIASRLLLTVENYQLNLQPELLTSDATDRSDHSSFWQKQIPAVSITENFFDNPSTGICSPAEPNPYYHRPGDTTANINTDYAYTIAQTVILTIAQLAGPL
jgi:hypothetical protein